MESYTRAIGSEAITLDSNDNGYSLREKITLINIDDSDSNFVLYEFENEEGLEQSLESREFIWLDKI